MRRLTVWLLITMVILSGVAALCQDELPAPAVAASEGVVQTAAGFVLYPWVTFALILVGMMLIISEIVSIGPWGATGIVGMLCVGSVVGASLAAGVAACAGIVLLLAGLLLLLVESRVLPGRGISVLAGLVCLFLGLFWTLGGASVGALYAASASAFFTLLSGVAFIAHLPTNSAWSAVRRDGWAMSGRSQVPGMSTGRARIARTGESSMESPVVEESTPPAGPARRTTDTDDQQIINRNG